MRPLCLAALLALSGPASAGQVEIVPTVETGVSGNLGGVTAPVPVQFTVPALDVGTSLLAPSVVTPTPLLDVGAGNVAQVTAFKSQAIVPTAFALPQSAVVSGAASKTLVPTALKPVLPAADKEGDPLSLDGTGADGRALFDQAKAAKPLATPATWGQTIKSWLNLGEIAPAWPGQSGQKVRVGGRTFVLADKLADGGGSTVWNTTSREFVVKIIHPEFMGLEHYAGEASMLRALDKADLPIARLVAASADGSVLVKEKIEGDGAAKVLAKGNLFDTQRHGWPDLAAKLIAAGVTADLARGNLVWQMWRSRWVIVDAGGVKDSGPGDVLAQLMTPDVFSGTGITPAGFLAGLRSRLGPYSPRWAETVRALKASPKLSPYLKDLAAHDAALPAAPELVFGPAPRGPAGLDDAVVSPKEVRTRLGYDPRATKTKVKLHGEDPGKLNTLILSIEEPGKPPVIMKSAQWAIIRNELILRRFARRWFGRYLRVPASIGVQDGMDSWMVMEKADASPSYYANLPLEQRVATALLVHTFGVGDVNPGNVLTGAGLPWLIDFEQALSRHRPSSARLPDERIALEMPWMSRFETNHPESYHPAVRAWRELLAKPETGEEIVSDLMAVGFTRPDAEHFLSVFRANAADLDWTLQNDADFVNQFVRRNSPQR